MQIRAQLASLWLVHCLLAWHLGSAAAQQQTNLDIPLWNEQQIMAEYLDGDAVYKTAKFGAVVSMAADGSLYLAGSPGTCSVFVYTTTTYGVLDVAGVEGDLTVRETLNSPAGSNANMYNHTAAAVAALHSGLLVGPKAVPAYAYPPFYQPNPDPQMDDGRNAANPNVRNNPANNGIRADIVNPALYRRQAVLFPPNFNASKPGSLSACVASSYGKALSVLPYRGHVTTDAGAAVEVTALAAVGAFYDRTGEGRVFVFAKAAAAAAAGVGAGNEAQDLGEGWFYMQQLVHNTSLPSNIKAFFGTSVGLAFTDGDGGGGGGDPAGLGGGTAGATLLVGGTGLNRVISFFLPRNGTAAEDPASGASRVYRWGRDAPIERQRRDVTEGAADRFGEVLQLSALPADNGQMAVIGASSYAGGVGRAYVYRLQLTPTRLWQLLSVLKPIDPRPGHLFGSAVSLSGSHVAVGMCAGTGTRQSAGSVHVYKTRSTGSAADYSLQVRLKPRISAQGDDFGCSVAIVRTEVPIPQAVSIAQEQHNEDYYKTVLFVGAWNSHASTAVTGGGPGDHKGAVHTFVTANSDLQAEDGYVWEEGALLSMYERVGMVPEWSPDPDSDNPIASRFGRTIAVSMDSKNIVVGHDYLEWQNDNLNPGMVVYFHDSMIEAYYMPHLLVACNSFLMLLGLLSVAFCGSLCVGTCLKRGRSKRIQFNTLDMSSEKHVLYSVGDGGGGGLDHSDHKSLLHHEGGGGGGEGEDSDSGGDADVEAGTRGEGGGIKIRKPLRKARFPGSLEMVGLGAGAGAGKPDAGASLAIDLGDMEGGAGSGYAEEISGAETATATSALTLTHSSASESSSVARARVVPSASNSTRAKDYGRTPQRGTILPLRARDMVFDLLLSLSTSVCAYCFFYLLDLRNCTAAFYGLLMLHVVLGVMPAVLILSDAFFPLLVRRTCVVSCLWTGLEPYHLILRNLQNYRHAFVQQQQQHHRDRGSAIGAIELSGSSSNDTRDLVQVPQRSRYASFVWSALNRSEKLIVVGTLLGGGGAMTSMLRFLPWRQTVFCVHSGGYPTYSVLKFAEYPANLLHVIYAIVLATALWGDRAAVTDPTLAYSVAGAGDTAGVSGASGSDGAATAEPLSALALSLDAADTTDWARQRAGYMPLHLDIITSGGWLAVLFLALCCVTVSRSLWRFCVPVWLQGKGKTQVMYECLGACYAAMCTCCGLLQCVRHAVFGWKDELSRTSPLPPAGAGTGAANTGSSDILTGTTHASSSSASSAIAGHGMRMQDLGSGRVWLEEGVDDDDYVDNVLEGSHGANPSHWLEDGEDYEEGEEEEEDHAGSRGWWDGPESESFSKLPQPQQQPQQQQRQHRHHQSQRQQSVGRTEHSDAPAAVKAASAVVAVSPANPTPQEREKQELMQQARASQRKLLRPPTRSL